MRNWKRWTAGWLGCCVLSALGSVHAADSVAVVTGKDPAELEAFAAREAAALLEQLYDVDVTPADALPEEGNVIVIGGPASGAAAGELTDRAWPALSEQGFAIRSFRRGSLQGTLIGGGSPVATLWAVYEWGHQLGVRSLPHGDFFPDQTAFAHRALDIQREPRFVSRTWRTVNDFPIGPESWSVADQRRLFRQLAKLKFNRVMLSVYPWQPFVRYRHGGVQKQTALLWYGERFPIFPDSPGRTALRGLKEFVNPDFAGASNADEMIEAGIRHARGVIRAAQEVGLQAGISISPLEFPREFEGVAGLEGARGLKNLLVAPGGKARPDDPQLQQLVAAKIRAYLETYPEVDTLYLTLPEFPEWDQHAELAWEQLSERIGADAPSLDQLVAAARNRPLTASGDRGERAVKGNIVTLAFLQRVLSDSTLLRRPDGTRVSLVVTAADPALFPYLDRLVPDGAATLNFVDYTARRVAQNKRLLEQVPARKVSSRLIMTLADDNVGVLSQSTTTRLGELVDTIGDLEWDGFATRYWMIAELDPSIYFLARSAWDGTLTPRRAHDELFTTITGKQSVSDRLWLGFQQIEKAAELTDQHDLGFAFPVPGLLMKHYRAVEPPGWWEAQNAAYTEAMIELYRSRDAAHPRSQPLLFYYAKRSEYVLDYLKCVQALRQAALARENGQNDEAVTHLETAVEAMYNAIDTLGDVAQDPSDRGLIALLNAYAFRPLMAEYERMLDAE